MIPNQPIHFCRNINDGYQYNPQLDMLPLYGDGHGKGALLAEVAQAGGVAPEDIVGSDLYLYVRTPGCVWGQTTVSSPAPALMTWNARLLR